MSILVSENINSNGTVSANTIKVGNIVINSTSLACNNGTTPVFSINTSTISVGNSVTNTQIVPQLNKSSITVNGNIITAITAQTTPELCNVQIFTVPGSNTWFKPSWAASYGSQTTSSDLVFVHLWGGGGGGNTTTTVSGGGGGAYVFGVWPANFFDSSVSVYIGAGGSAGVNGANTSFNSIPPDIGSNFYWNNLLAYGGAAGKTAIGGGGGGWTGVGNTTGSGGAGGIAGGTPGAPGADSTFGGGGGGNTAGANGGYSVYGGGGASVTTGVGGQSLYGGGGGAGSTGNVGISIYGGSGGNSSVAPTMPGGGGAGTTNTTGANGKIIVITIRKMA